MTLFDLTAEFQSLLHRLDEQDGDVPPEVLADLERIESDIHNKADGYCSLIRHYEAMDAACANEANRLFQRAAAFNAKARWLKDRLHDAILRTGGRKLQTATNTITVCANGGAEPVSIDIEPEQLPEGYRIVKTLYKPDVDAIRDTLQAGHHVPGCSLKERGTHLRMK